MAGIAEEGGGESQLLKALGATEKEAGLLEAGGEAVEKELKTGVLGAKSAIERPVKISGAGHFFSRHSPCEWMVEKYSELLGTDAGLKAEYEALEKEAAELSKAADVQVDVAAEGTERLSKSEQAAEALLDKIAALDEKLAKEMAWTQAAKKFRLLEPASAAKLLNLEKGAAIRLANLDLDTLDPELPEGTLKNLGAVDEAALKTLAEMEPAALASRAATMAKVSEIKTLFPKLKAEAGP